MLSKCWIYSGKLSDNGYGTAVKAVDGVAGFVHRLVYEVLIGPIPEGLELDHTCRVRSCYNPYHLDPVTHQENIRRGENWQRNKTHCTRGNHPLSGDNLFLDKNGYRECRICRAERRKIYKDKKKRERTLNDQ